MATPAASCRAIAALYAGLAPVERVRLMARLARAHDTAEPARRTTGGRGEAREAYAVA